MAESEANAGQNNAEVPKWSQPVKVLAEILGELNKDPEIKKVMVDKVAQWPEMQNAPSPQETPAA